MRTAIDMGRCLVLGPPDISFHQGLWKTGMVLHPLVGLPA